MRTILLIFLASPSVISLVSDCPKPTISIGDNQCLLPVGINNFYEAQMDCINMGGYLPSVLSSAQNEIIKQLANDRVTCNGVWLGMDDREFWTDGKDYNYSNWMINGTDTQSISFCVILDKTSGQWRNMTCDVNFAYFCTVPLNQTLLLYPNQNINVCMNASLLPAVETLPKCPGTSSCSSHFDIISVVAVENQSKYSESLEILDRVTSECGSKDVGLLITPDKVNQNGCNFKKMGSKSFWAETGKAYNVDSVNVTGELVQEMLDKAKSCHNYNGKTAGVLYFLTDLTCADMCTSTFPAFQADFINGMLDNGYVVNFIHLDDVDNCLDKMLPQCTRYGSSQCFVTTLSTNSTSKVQENNIKTCNSKGVSVGLVIALVIVSILSFIGLIGVFYMRWRLQKAGGWKRFWKSEAQRGIDYGDMPIDGWELEKGQLEVLEDKQLGSGAFAVVFEGILTGKRPVDIIHPTANLSSDVSGRVAVKRVPPHADWFAKKEFIDEVRFMKKLGSHSHILGMIGCVTRAELPMMCLELCELGNLLSFVRSKKDEFTLEDSGSFRMKDLISIGWQVSDGLSYLKTINVIHRDLAARNILLTKSLTAKISDFGLCRLADSSVYISKGGRLPIKWMAIESLRLNSFSHQSDVWSFGILLWEMFTFGEAPFPSIQPADLLEHLERGERPPQPEICSPKIFKILESCWIEEAERRNEIEAIRCDFSSLLHESSIYYGYMDLPSMQLNMKLADLDEEAEEQGLEPIGEREEESGDIKEIRSVFQFMENETKESTSFSEEILPVESSEETLIFEKEEDKNIHNTSE